MTIINRQAEEVASREAAENKTAGAVQNGVQAPFGKWIFFALVAVAAFMFWKRN